MRLEFMKLISGRGLVGSCITYTHGAKGREIESRSFYFFDMTPREEEVFSHKMLLCSIGKGVLKRGPCRDTGNNFFVHKISGGSVTFPGTRIVG